MYKLWKETVVARETLANKLNLIYHVDMQDWEYEVSDPKRILDFITEYKKTMTNNAEKISLMEIILDSLNSALSDGKNSQQINQITTELISLLKANKKLHLATIEYWQNDWEVSYLLKDI